MHHVFETAHQRGMDVYFAVDVDTESANPQDMILRLPESDRFRQGELWLPRPDTAGGYAFYKAQAEYLLKTYPQITDFVVWFRKGGQPWTRLKLTDLPEAWQQEWHEAVKKNPAVAEMHQSHNMLAFSKIIKATQRAIREIGRQDVRVATGSWDFLFLPGADHFFPTDVTFIPLDWMVLRDQSQMATAERRAATAQVGKNRPMIPVVWAHHDDGNYVGRPYTPFPDFYDKLVDSAASGFGIIHWTTRPLDVYFTSCIRQVFQQSKNEPIEATCRRMAMDLFGPRYCDAMTEYLVRWVHEAGLIGRETTDFFIDHVLSDRERIEQHYKERMAILNAVPIAGLTPSQKGWLRYFKGLEQFIVGVYETEQYFNEAKAAYGRGDMAAAREAIAHCRPEQVIQQYADFSSEQDITAGEKGLIASMNTRWLSHYIRFRQQLGLEPVRYNYGPTLHEYLAQSRGIFTFYFEPDRTVWAVFGEDEVNAIAVPRVGTTDAHYAWQVLDKPKTITVFEIPDSVTLHRPEGLSPAIEEICRNGIVSDHPIEVTVQPIMAYDGRVRVYMPEDLAAGDYALTLYFVNSPVLGVGKDVFEARVRVVKAADRQHRNLYTFAPQKARYMRLLCKGNSLNHWNHLRELLMTSLLPGGEVKASGYQEGFEPNLTIDGNLQTRWAAEGRNQWIQYELDPDRTADQLRIFWNLGEERKYSFDLQFSQDGLTWTPVKYAEAESESAIPTPVMVRQIDLAKSAPTPNQIFTVAIPLRLESAGTVELSLVPIKGKASLCGLVLEPK
jgi:hypothetical protein